MSIWQTVRDILFSPLCNNTPMWDGEEGSSVGAWGEERLCFCEGTELWNTEGNGGHILSTTQHFVGPLNPVPRKDSFAFSKASNPVTWVILEGIANYYSFFWYVSREEWESVWRNLTYEWWGSTMGCILSLTLSLLIFIITV